MVLRRPSVSHINETGCTIVHALKSLCRSQKFHCSSLQLSEEIMTAISRLQSCEDVCSATCWVGVSPTLPWRAGYPENFLLARALVNQILIETSLWHTWRLRTCQNWSEAFKPWSNWNSCTSEKWIWKLQCRLEVGKDSTDIQWSVQRGHPTRALSTVMAKIPVISTIRKPYL